MSKTQKRILFLTYTDGGGAGIANLNIAKAFIDIGYSVEFIVAEKTSSEYFVSEISRKNKTKKYEALIFRVLKKVYLKLKEQTRKKNHHNNKSKYFYYNENESVSIYKFEDIIHLVKSPPDIVIAGWISKFINLETLGKIALHFKATPHILMNDMAPITGGCHYSWDCLGYLKDCSNCPAVPDYLDQNSSLRNLQQKKVSIENYGISVIAGSKSTQTEALKSFLYKEQSEIKIINGIIDFTIFNSRNRQIARELFGFPTSKKIILTGASWIDDPRKGFDKFAEVLKATNKILKSEGKELTVIMVGNNNNYSFDFENIQVLKFESISNKFFFSLLYKVADLYVSPSVEDSGPVMVVEALATGLPVIGFNIGFVSDFVKNNLNGYIVTDFDISDMALKIIELLYHSDLQILSKNAEESIKYAFSKEQLLNIF